ncbi:hypothetical protein CLOP_g1077 [Closterium sp. NIES-67]|nr:hypothetical protein CLOP_g1077 [Closterium sp. NIES-67]
MLLRSAEDWLNMTFGVRPEDVATYHPVFKDALLSSVRTKRRYTGLPSPPHCPADQTLWPLPASINVGSQQPRAVGFDSHSSRLQGKASPDKESSKASQEEAALVKTPFASPKDPGNLDADVDPFSPLTPPSPQTPTFSPPVSFFSPNLSAPFRPLLFSPFTCGASSPPISSPPSASSSRNRTPSNGVFVQSQSHNGRKWGRPVGRLLFGDTGDEDETGRRREEEAREQDLGSDRGAEIGEVTQAKLTRDDCASSASSAPSSSFSSSPSFPSRSAAAAAKAAAAVAANAASGRPAFVGGHVAAAADRYRVLAEETARLEEEYEVGERLGSGHFGCARVCRERRTGRLLACKSIDKAKLRYCGKEEQEEEAQARKCATPLSSPSPPPPTPAPPPPPSAASPLQSLLSPAIRVKLADFGLSVFLPPGQLVKGLAGSPYYLAPEVPSGWYGFPADIWSLGVVLYLMLSGHVPYYGKTDAEILRAIECGTTVSTIAASTGATSSNATNSSNCSSSGEVEDCRTASTGASSPPLPPLPPPPHTTSTNTFYPEPTTLLSLLRSPFSSPRDPFSFPQSRPQPSPDPTAGAGLTTKSRLSPSPLQGDAIQACVEPPVLHALSEGFGPEPWKQTSGVASGAVEGRGVEWSGNAAMVQDKGAVVAGRGEVERRGEQQEWHEAGRREDIWERIELSESDGDGDGFRASGSESGSGSGRGSGRGSAADGMQGCDDDTDGGLPCSQVGGNSSCELWEQQQQQGGCTNISCGSRRRGSKCCAESCSFVSGEVAMVEGGAVEGGEVVQGRMSAEGMKERDLEGASGSAWLDSLASDIDLCSGLELVESFYLLL